MIVHAWEAWGEAAFARFNGQFAHRAVGRGRRDARSCARPARRPAALPLRARRAPVVRERGQGDLRRRPGDPPGAGSRRPRRDVHVLDADAAADRVRGRDRARAWPRPRPSRAGGRSTGLLGAALPDGWRRPSRATSRTPLERVRAASRRPCACGWCGPTSPVGSYLSGGLDSSLVAALGRRRRVSVCKTSRSVSRTPSTTRRRSSGRWPPRIGSDHREITVPGADIAAVFPDVVRHAERPLLRTAPAPLFLLSRLVREAGIKVVLTGEGADEMFAGYDLFREGKVRRFWGRQPESSCGRACSSACTPTLPGRRSPSGHGPRVFRPRSRALGGAGLRPRDPLAARQRRSSGSSPRTSAVSSRPADVVGRLLGSLPADFTRWPHLAQDQYLEDANAAVRVPALVAGRPDADGPLGRGPVPVPRRGRRRARQRAAVAFKLRGLDEKHVLKRAAAGLVPEAILRRPKQPYRAPDAHAFAGDRRARLGGERLSPSGRRRSPGIFDPAAVGAPVAKCRAQPADAAVLERG